MQVQETKSKRSTNIYMVRDAIDLLFHLTTPVFILFQGELRLQVENKQAVHVRAATLASDSAYVECCNQVCRLLLEIMEYELFSGKLTAMLGVTAIDIADPDKESAALRQGMWLIEQCLEHRMTRLGKFRCFGMPQ